MRPFTNHIHAAILRVIAKEAGLDPADRKKPIMIVEEIRSTDWASATFVGARHTFDLRFEGADAAIADVTDRLIAVLPEVEIPISGHIVAEIAATPVNTNKQNVNLAPVRLLVNVLTIVD
jgi:hypothetical protein